MSNPRPSPVQGCPECFRPHPSGLPSRRDVLWRAAGMAAAGAAASSGLLGRIARAADAGGGASASAPVSETLVAQLYGSLTDEQRKAVCFGFDDPLRSKVDNNWFIVKQSIGKLFDKDQQALIHDIFMDLHSEEYAKRVYDQVEHDNIDDGGFSACAIALFGEPDKSSPQADLGTPEQPPKSKFEFVLTGRHVTRRCDGNSVAGAAFGGPIFYGHAAEGFHESAQHKGNAYWFQALRANQVFQALDGKQRDIALLGDPRTEQGSKTVALRNNKEGLTGLAVGEMSHDQKDLVRKVLADLLAPFRKADADEALKLIEDGGFDDLHMAFYKNMDIGNDGVWDVWQIEGPSMLWYFRGAPHVHTWVHVREPAKV
jgi:hypothetical protein